MTTTNSANAHRPHVLLVEDDDNVAYVMQHALAGAYEVIRVSNVSHARTTMATLSFDVIILDWRLGVERGKELLDHLPHKEGRAVPPTIVASGDTSEGEALKCGATFVIHKPFSLKDLVAAVERVLASPPEP